MDAVNGKSINISHVEGSNSKDFVEFYFPLREISSMDAVYSSLVVKGITQGAELILSRIIIKINYNRQI